MIILAILLCIASIGISCWVFFMLSVFALPLLAGVWAGTWIIQIGSGLSASILAGMLTGALTLTLVQLLLGAVRSL